MSHRLTHDTEKHRLSKQSIVEIEQREDRWQVEAFFKDHALWDWDVKDHKCWTLLHFTLDLKAQMAAILR